MNKVTQRNTCRGCKSTNLHKILDLGDMPLAGGFLKPEDIKNEDFIPLDLFYCEECKLIQICHIVNPEILFKKYFYISSIIPQLSKHFLDYSIYLKNNYLLGENPKILELGCNDGVLLQYFKNNETIFSLGIEPSKNVSKLAKEKGINVINEFFSEHQSHKIYEKYGTFDVITGSNMFAHIDDIIDIIHGVKNIIKENGVFIFEVHYLLDLMKDFQYDTIYHEHLTYYSVLAIKKIFQLQGMKIIDVIHLDMHGGGIRVVTSLETSKKKVKRSVNIFIDKEVQYGLDKIDTYLGFGDKVIEHKKNLVQLLTNLKKEGKRIVGYGAPGRGTILLNYCNINNNILDYIVDISPLRKGMLMPGVHIEIKDPSLSKIYKPDYFLVLARNYIDSILDQEKELYEEGVRFIVPFPKIKIL